MDIYCKETLLDVLRALVKRRLMVALLSKEKKLETMIGNGRVSH